VVEEELAGRGATIKAYTIATQALGRGPEALRRAGHRRPRARGAAVRPRRARWDRGSDRSRVPGAYTIATQALGRGPDFDPSLDPSVRVEAGRLRRALAGIVTRTSSPPACRA
jgi:hypothetical protein